jgi:serine protease Do
LRFGTLVAVTLVLAAAFVTVVDLPEHSLAQQPQSEVIQSRPAPIAAAQPVLDLGNAFSAVAEAVRPSVVFINAERRVETGTDERHPDLPPPFDRFFIEPRERQDQPRGGSGSGFIISPNGHIITNNHVVEGFDRIEVQLFDGREFDADVIGRDPDTDIAVIKINGSDFPAASLGNSDSLRVGEWVLAIGNPLGDAFSFSVTAGIVSGRGRGLRGLQRSQWTIHDFIQTDAAINPGNSGGPLVNIRGQVIGVNAAIASQTGYYAGYSFAIPMSLVRTVADQLIADGKVTRAALGIQVQDADDEDAEYAGLDAVRGVLVVEFSGADSPARKAGIEREDIILEVDGRRVDYVAQLQQVVGFKRPGEVVDVVVARRGGERKTIQVRLTEANAEPQEVAAAEPSDPEEPAFQNKLGVAVEEMTAQMEAIDERLGSENRGLVVVAVDPNGPARGELTPPDPQRRIIDVITHVDGEPVTTLSELRDLLSSVEAGDIVSLRVFTLQGQLTQTRVVRIRAGG